MTRTAADVLNGRLLAERYRDIGRSILRDAFLSQVAGKALTARVYRQRAAIARRAALAEELDPQPEGLP